MNSKIIIKTWAAIAAVIMLAPAVFAEDLAIVVNKACNMDNISSADLAKVFKAEKLKNGDGVKYVLATQAAESAEKKCVLENIYKMSDSDYEKFFLQAVFAGSVAAPPKVVAGSSAVKAFISSAPGAICYMKASDADSSVKVLKVDGKAPGDADYPLKLK
jgi:ABC-type phosphate transport system substrate-binding protein